MYGDIGYIWVPVLSAQFCCETETTIKYKIYENEETNLFNFIKKQNNI